MPEKRRLGGEIFPEQTAPATPSAGTVVVYAKSDGKLYAKDDAGVETALGGGAADVDDQEFLALWGAI